MTLKHNFQKFQAEALSTPITLGTLARSRFLADPKLLPIYLSRYKFVSKMLSSKDNVLEVGCGDGFAAPIISQVCSQLSLTDIDHNFVSEAKDRNPNNHCFQFNFVESPGQTLFNVIYSLDVIEHINSEQTPAFIINLKQTLEKGGMLILGTPSLESQVYASSESVKGHVNCRTQSDWLAFLHDYFLRVLPFSMNDEVLHTGFSKMAHYLFFVCLYPRDN